MGKIKIPKFWKNKKIRKIVLIFGAIILALACFVFAYNTAYSQKIFPKTYVAGVNLGGKTEQEARDILQKKIEDNKDTSLKIMALDKEWIVTNQDLEINYSTEKSASLAWSVGRKGGFGKILLEQLKSIFSSNHNLASFDLNQEKFSQTINQATSEVNIPEKDATIKIKEDMTPVIEDEVPGRNLPYSVTSSMILEAIGNFQQQVSLPVEEVLPKVTKANCQDAYEKTLKILQSKLVLKSEQTDYELQANDFYSWISYVGVPIENKNSENLTGGLKLAQKDSEGMWKLEVQINLAKVGDYLSGISSEINQNAQDAKFQVVDGKVIAFQIAQTGYQLDQEKAVKQISNALIEGKPQLVLPVKVTQPEIGSSDPAKEGLVELVGEGHTNWNGSPRNRIHNLTLGTEKISGTIVKPGEEFSTVKTLGEIDGAAGFLPELVIKNSTQVVPEYGGGLCQVSTTLFRAILNSGLQITQREAHSFRVSYYEPPVGMDATIYDPAPDFRFVNNLSTPILIWGYAGNNSLTFQIYGTKDGRKIEISDPWVGNYVSPGEPVYTESSSLAEGEIRQVERALAGCTASFHYKVTSAKGEVLQDEEFVSKYVALSNSYLYGPGTVIEGVTDQPPPEEPPPPSQ